MTTALAVRRATLPVWRGAAAPRPVPTLWPALGWLGLFVYVVASFDVVACTAAEPCGPELDRVLLETGVLIGAFWVWLLPRWATPLAVALGTAWSVDLVADPGGLPLVVVLPVVVGLAAWTVLAGAVVRSREASAAELAAAAPQAVWPGPVPAELASPSRLEGLRVAVALAAVAGLLLAWSAVHGAREAAEEARAERLVGTVVAHGDDGFLIDVQVGDEVVELDTWEAGDYPVGSTQELLRTDDELRLVAEPYDPGGWQSLALGIGALAVVLGVRGRRRARALQRLLTEPQPVLAVRLLPLGDAVVLAADDTDDRGPALCAVPVSPVGDDEEPDDPWQPTGEPATAYGVPLPGHAVAFLLTGSGEALLPHGLGRRAPQDLRTPFTGDPEEQAAPPLSGPHDPRLEVLRPPAWRTPLGWALALGALVGCAVVAATAEGPGSGAWRLLVALNLGVGGLLAVSSRVDADAAGLRVSSPLRARHLPWTTLSGVDVVDGSVVLLTRDDEVVLLPWPQTGWGLLRRPGRDTAVRTAAAALRAEVARASGSAAPVERRRLVAPVYAAAVVVAVLVGLVVRWSA